MREQGYDSHTERVISINLVGQDWKNCNGQQFVFTSLFFFCIEQTFVKAYTCYRLTTVAVILVNLEFSLISHEPISFKVIKEMNGKAGIVEST